MESLTAILIGIPIILLLFLFHHGQRRPKNFPPGPPGLPIIGNILDIGAAWHSSTFKMTKKYGDIIGVAIGQVNYVMFHNVDDIREIFGMTEFSGRGLYNVFLETSKTIHNEGVVLSDGPIWTDLRRFSLKTLRDFGFGRRSMESIILEEAEDLIQVFQKTAGKPISTSTAFNSAVLNIIWRIIAGKRYSHDDPQMAELLNLVFDFMKNAVSRDKILYFMFPPILKLRLKFPFLFPNTSGLFRKKLFKFLKETIAEHRKTIQVGNRRDFIDSFLEQTMVTSNNSQTSFKSNDDDYGLCVLLMDFFIAGSETTSITLSWSAFLLSMHPQVEQKLYAEIQRVVGNRAVTLADRDNLPYVECTMTEIHRMASLLPRGVTHALTQDITFKGYSLPKGTLVGGNAYAVHFNEITWGDPHVFRPDRFLSEDGNFVRSKFVIPFSTGKRMCLGESLAQSEFFIFLANLVQNFQITKPSDEPPHSLEGQHGGVLTPEPHRVILVLRD